MTRDITKDQHWAPASHFKKFQKENGDLEILDIRNWRLCNPRHHSRVCFEYFFYAQKTGVPDEISQKLETNFGLIEKYFEDAYPDIIKTISSTTAIGNDILVHLSYYMAHLWMRSKRFRELQNISMEEAEKRMIKLTINDPQVFESICKTVEAEHDVWLSDDDKRSFKKMINDESYRIKQDNKIHLESFKHIEEFAKYFYIKKWRFYTLINDLNFFTSDTPVIEVFPKRASFYGSHITERKHYFPLSPKILVELSNPDKPGKNVKRKMLKQRSEVDYFNLQRINHSHEFVYSNDTYDLKRVLRQYK